MSEHKHKHPENAYPKQLYTIENEGLLEGTMPSAPPCYDEAVGNAPGVQNVQYSMVSPMAQTVQPTANPVVLSLRTPLPVGPDPITTTCPCCNTYVTSRTSKKNNIGKYVCCLAMFMSVICMCCSCIPLCIWGPVRTSHFCPKCNAFFGMYTASL